MAGGLWSETCVGSQLGRKGWPELISILVTAPPQPRQVSSSTGLHCPGSEVAPLARPRQGGAAFVPALLCHRCPASWHSAMAPCYLRLCAVTFCHKTFEVLRICLPVIMLPTTDCLSPRA